MFVGACSRWVYTKVQITCLRAWTPVRSASGWGGRWKISGLCVCVFVCSCVCVCSCTCVCVCVCGMHTNARAHFEYIESFSGSRSNICHTRRCRWGIQKSFWNTERIDSNGHPTCGFLKFWNILYIFVADLFSVILDYTFLKTTVGTKESRIKEVTILQ
jgi:hypothetical protein